MKKYLFPLFILVALFSCRKKEEILVLDNIENGEISDVLSFKKDGEVWKPSREWNFYNSGPPLRYEFNLNPNSSRDNFYITAERTMEDAASNCIVCDYFSLLANVVDTGYFDISEAGIEDLVSNDSCDYIEIDFIKLDSTANNFIRVIEIDRVKNAVAGYFEFTTINSMCNDTVTISDGRFRLGFE